MKRRSFLPLYVTNFFGVVNDNFLKTLAGFVLLSWLADEKKCSTLMGATAAALVLPYILCSPLADRLTCVFEKKRIFRLAKWAELPIVALAILGFHLHSIPVVIGAILLMGLQSSLYSPAKYALVRDVGGEDRISTGMGGMEGVAFLAVLGGTIAASCLSESVAPWVHYLCLGSFALLGLGFSCAIRADEEKNRAIHSMNPIRYMARAYRVARNYRGLNAVIFTLSVFWFAAAMLQQGLIVYCKQVLALDDLHTGMMLCVAVVGIVLGQVLAGFVDRRRFLLGAVLVTGWIAAAIFFGLFFVNPRPVPFAAALAVLAFDFGFFKLPFDTEIQKVVKGPRINTMLAYFNQVSFLFMFVASGFYIAISHFFGPRAFLAFLGLVMLVAPVVFVFNYRSVLCFVGRWIFSRRYDVTLAVGGTTALPIANGEPPPASGQLPSANFAYLFLPNHPAMVDPMLVTAEFWRIPLKPLSDERFLDRGGVSSKVLKTLGCVKVPDLRNHRSTEGAKIARGLQDVVIDALESGDNVIFYPSGHIWTEPKEEIGTRQLAYNVCRALPPSVRVVGIRTSGLWGSIWSRKGRTNSPSFLPTLLESVFKWFFVAPFVPRRKVSMHVEDLTERTREWARLTRLEFNRKMEEWYNEND
jgi:MFS family permease